MNSTTLITILIILCIVNTSVNALFKTNSFNTRSKSIPKSSRVIEQYFDAWNRRSMDEAASLFSDECVYEDTLYPETFKGQKEVKFHLNRVANALPENFKFVVDEISGNDSSGMVGVQWHVESMNDLNDEIGIGKPLPFARGASMYTVENGLITKGFDVPEPTLKSGNLSLKLLESASSIIALPKRAIAWSAWGLYCYFLFFSNVLPGPNALQLDPYTWTEVKSLSLNFFLVLPILDGANASVLHPGLEAIFNMVLAWAALFAGFVIDGRQTYPVDSIDSKKNRKSMLPTLGIMQALTNAAFLPYLATREPESTSSLEDLSNHKLTSIEKVGESRALPIVLGGVFTLCIYWFFEGRQDAFGDIPTRIDSLLTLLSTDRLGTSFIVDLTYFALFQGWLIDDDVRRREVVNDDPSRNSAPFAGVAKFVPFYGLVAHMLTRTQIKGSQEPEEL